MKFKASKNFLFEWSIRIALIFLKFLVFLHRFNIIVKEVQEILLLGYWDAS